MMDEDGRMNAVLESFAQCTHQEQLALLEELPKLLCRDFLSLPDIAVRKILSYLTSEPLHRILGYTLVSRHWHQVISEYEPIWKTHYHKLHKVQPHIGSFKEATIATLKFERDLLRRSKTYSLQEVEPVRAPIGISSEWFYNVDNPHRTLVLVHSSNRVYPVDLSLSDPLATRYKYLHWVWSAGEGALFHDNTGQWSYIAYPDVSTGAETVTLSVQNWQEPELFGPSEVVWGGCTDCRLVVRVRRFVDQNGRWNMDAVLLIDDAAAEMANKQTIQFEFLPNECRSSSLFIMKAVQLHCVEDERSPNEHYCRKHLAFFQIGVGIHIAMFELSLTDQGFKLSSQLQSVHSFCPPDLQWTDIGKDTPSNMVLSKDSSLVGLLPNKYTLCVWNLKTGFCHSHVLALSEAAKRSPPTLTLVALDELYTVIGHTLRFPHLMVELQVVSTTTGRGILNIDWNLGTVPKVGPIVSMVHLKELMVSNAPDSSQFKLCFIAAPGTTQCMYVCM